MSPAEERRPVQLVLISPEQDRPDEARIVAALFAAGLERYHVRKPNASAADLLRWLEQIPTRWHRRLVLHHHHLLVERCGLGGRHWPDNGNALLVPPAGTGMSSRSCHDLTTLQATLGVFDSVFFGPLFPSLSKPGYGADVRHDLERVRALLAQRGADRQRTTVLALGGIDARTALHALAVGFDGVAVLGAVWQAPDPLGAFNRLRSAVAGFRASSSEQTAAPAGSVVASPASVD